MMQQKQLDQHELVINQAIDESSELQDLDDDELDIFGGCGHRRGRMSHRGRSHGRGSHSSFKKHSLSISGQTITKPDGTSITSFTMQQEDISSESSEMSYGD